MRSIRTLGLGPLSRPFLFVMTAISLLLSACGGQGGGSTVVPLPTLVIVDDAPILNARVADRFGRVAEADPFSPGRYLFDSSPTLPLTITSRNLVGSNGRVNVASLDGVWYSYIDVNGNGRLDENEERALLTFQDLDGNGLYTQSVDIVFTGAFEVKYAKLGSNAIQANLVASLLPSNWDGATPVAGLSSSALNAAVNSAPSQSGNPELQRATAALTAISEGLLSTLRSSGASGSTAAAQATISSALAAVGAPGSQVDLNKSDPASVAKLAQTISQAVPAAAQTQASNLVTNVKVVQASANPTSATESIVKVTQERLTEFQRVLDADAQGKLTEDVALAVNAITSAQSEAKPGVDPDATRIAELRIVPLGIPDSVTEQTSRTTVLRSWIDLSSTRGFSLARQPDGTLGFTATGEPFQAVLGASSRVLPFFSARNSWEYTGSGGETLKVKINFSVPLFNTQGGTDLGASSQVSMMQLCSAAGACAYYIMATAQQMCSPDWSNFVNSWPADVGLTARQSFYNAVNTVNKNSVSCGG
jgi:hypothetical protein